MTAIDSRSCIRNAALSLIGMCVALACAHAEETLRDDARNAVPIERGEPFAAPASLSSCAEPTGNSTGPRLHFEVRVDDRAVDPLACLPVRTMRRP